MTNPADAMREALELLKEIEFFAANNAKSAHLIMDKEVWRAHARKVREVVAALSASRTDRDGVIEECEWALAELRPSHPRSDWTQLAYDHDRWITQCIETVQRLKSAPAPPEGQGK
jgi:hypothetical protein